jgi:hypothetical protein
MGEHRDKEYLITGYIIGRIRTARAIESFSSHGLSFVNKI